MRCDIATSTLFQVFNGCCQVGERGDGPWSPYVVPSGGMFARRAPGTCPPRHLCIKYLISRFILTLGSPQSRPHWTANLPCKAPCISRNMRIQQHKMSHPPLPTTTLAIAINWVPRMGQILRHGEKVLQIVWVRWGQKQARVGNGKKKKSPARARRANAPPLAQKYKPAPGSLPRN